MIASINIRHIVVVGSGVMGQGIAQACAVAGYEVALFDSNSEQTLKASRQIAASLEQAFVKGKLTRLQVEDAVRRMSVISSLEGTKADLFIEAIVELLEPKQQLLAQIESRNRGAILATNTSTFPVSLVAAKLREPGYCIGIHFFNPANVMKLVEVIPSSITFPAVVEAATTFLRILGKVSVTVRDSPGFVVNRVARSFYLESLAILTEGTAERPEVIDNLMQASGFKMGPFALMDLIGIDTNLAVTESLYEAFGKPEKFKPSPRQIQMVRDGRLGRKSGSGFYQY